MTSWTPSFIGSEPEKVTARSPSRTVVCTWKSTAVMPLINPTTVLVCLRVPREKSSLKRASSVGLKPRLLR